MCAFYFEPPLSEARGGGVWAERFRAALFCFICCLRRWGGGISYWARDSSRLALARRGEKGFAAAPVDPKITPGSLLIRAELCSGEIPMTFRRLPRINAHHVVCTNRPSNWPLRLNYEVVYERGWAWLLARDVHVHLKTTNNNGVVVEW